MKQRFTVNEKGLLEDRNGNVIGKLTSLTLEVPAPLPFAPDAEGDNRGSAVRDQQQTKEQTPRGPSEKQASEDEDPVRTVFLHWCSATDRDPEKTELTPSRRRTIERALKEATTTECCHAIDGLMKWRERKSGDTQLSAVFQTRPGGRPLREQIEWWMGQHGDGSQAGVTSEEMVKINRAKDAITTAHDMPDSEQAQESAKRAKYWLRERGWKVELGPNGRPAFVAP